MVGMDRESPFCFLTRYRKRAKEKEGEEAPMCPTEASGGILEAGNKESIKEER